MMDKKENLLQKCQSCGKRNFVTDNVTGEIFCKNCGYVIPEQVLETNLIPYDIDKCKTGAPTSLAKYDMGLSTVIGPANQDATGKPLSTSMKKHIKTLKLHDNRSLSNPSTERNLKIAFNYLLKLKDKIRFPDVVVEDAAYIYRKAVENNLIRGRSIFAIITAAVYAACRNNGIPRNLKDFAEVGNIKRKDIARCYRILLRELDLKVPIIDSIQCIPRIANKIQVFEKTQQYAIKILKIVYENGMAAGKDPMGLAAAALYLACVENGEGRTQREIAQSANVTEVTIRTRYSDLKKTTKKITNFNRRESL